MRARVLIVDDHASFRSFAGRLLAADGFTVVGEAADGAGAIAAARDLRPDLVLLDVQLPDIDGFAVADTLAVMAEPPAVVLVSSRSRDDYGSRVGGSSALGFVGKAELSGDALRRLLPEPGRTRQGASSAGGGRGRWASRGCWPGSGRRARWSGAVTRSPSTCWRPRWR